MFRNAQKQARTPTMKVFTVGLDQKPSMEKQAEFPSEVISVSPGTPPPIYPSDALRKKKPYKGILLCMLGVFLLMLFVVTLSEMAYNRERDQNFLRLRWAELKHRIGYYDGYQNSVGADRLSAHRIRPVESFTQMEATSPPTTSTQLPTTKAAEAQEANDDDSSNLDARLGFLKSILSKIKEKAEEMGMDGTMQVSVIQVEPEGMMGQNSDAFKNSFGEGQPSFFQNNDIGDHEERPGMFGPWASESAFTNNNDFANMFRQQSRFGFGENQEWNRPVHHPFDFGSSEFEGRGKPMGQFMGEAYGRRFGRFLQELLARRMNNLQEMTPITDNVQIDPRYAQQFSWPGTWQQQEQPQQWWWNQQPQAQQWWPQQQQQQQQQQPQQQIWGFDNQQPQRIQNHPDQQQLPPMIALPQENQWSQQQQQTLGVPQIPLQHSQTFQGQQSFQQQPQTQFQMFPSENFGQQQQQHSQQPELMQNQFSQQNQIPQQNFFQHVPFVNPADNIQIDPPQHQKPGNDDWKPWVHESRAWTHQNADQIKSQVQPETAAWQIPQNQPALEPSAPFEATDNADAAISVSDPSSTRINDDAPNDLQIDFPAVKFPVNDQQDQRIDPRFFQIDEPQPIQSESI